MTAADHAGSAHLRARRTLWEHDDPVYGPMVETGPAPKLSATPPRIKWPCRPAGHHNGHVLQKYFGYGPRRLAELHREGIVSALA